MRVHDHWLRCSSVLMHYTATANNPDEAIVDGLQAVMAEVWTATPSVDTAASPEAGLQRQSIEAEVSRLTALERRADLLIAAVFAELDAAPVS